MADPAPPPTKRYAGKRFTIGFIAILVSLLVASVLVNHRFEAVTARFEVLRREWGRVAELLETRFTVIDAAMQDDTGAAAEDYKRLRAAYLKSSLYDEQSRILTGLWESYETWRAGVAETGSSAPAAAVDGLQPLASLSPQDRGRLERFIAADKEAGLLLAEPLGRLTQTILLLDYPPRVSETLQDIFG